MQVQKDTLVTITLTIRSPEGDLLDQWEEPLIYLHGGYGDLAGHLEQALEGHGPGETILLPVQAENAFGPYDDNLLVAEPLSSFGGEPLEPGMLFEVEEAGETRQLIIVRVDPDKVWLDGNHPLSGDLVFEMQIHDVRLPDSQEYAENRARITEALSAVR